MNLDLFMYYTEQIPEIISKNPNPTPADILVYDDIIKRVVSYTNLIMKKDLAN